MKNKINRKLLPILFMSILILPTMGLAKEMLLCLPGFPGTPAQAQPYVDKMMRYLEQKLNMEAGSMSGQYYSDETKSIASLKKQKPEVALVGPSIYASLSEELKMKIIAQVEINGLGEEVYSVIVKKGSIQNIAELSGKVVSGSVVNDKKYVANVILDKQVAAAALTLKSEKRPLKSLRNVVRGKADAAIVDQSVASHLADLPFADELQVIYKSKSVPPPAVVVLGNGGKKIDVLKKSLLGMCHRPDGKELCKTLTISAIKPASMAKYKKLMQRYNR